MSEQQPSPSGHQKNHHVKRGLTATSVHGFVWLLFVLVLLLSQAVLVLDRSFEYTIPR